MTLEEALKPFNNRKADLAKALGISKQAVSRWPENQPIPELRAKQLKYEIIPKIKESKKAVGEAQKVKSAA